MYFFAYRFLDGGLSLRVLYIVFYWCMVRFVVGSSRSYWMYCCGLSVFVVLVRLSFCVSSVGWVYFWVLVVLLFVGVLSVLCFWLVCLSRFFYKCVSLNGLLVEFLLFVWVFFFYFYCVWLVGCCWWYCFWIDSFLFDLVVFLCVCLLCFLLFCWCFLFVYWLFYFIEDVVLRGVQVLEFYSPIPFHLKDKRKSNP